jgi:putative transposase
MRAFFQWYNTEHRHSGIAMMTPADVHTGQAEEVQSKRQAVLDAAYQKHPGRFVKGVPRARGVPEEVWINKPAA